MIFSNYFSNQARKPSGIFGRYVASIIFDKGNAELNDLMYETLAIKKNDHVLEIGFGTGKLMNKIAGQLEKGTIIGIDFSETMVLLATKTNQKYINAGKVIIHSGDFNDIAFDESCFDKVYTVNTIYFWKNPKSTISKICRILKPGGKLFIGFHDKYVMEKKPLSKKVFHFYTAHEITELLSSYGTPDDIDIKYNDGKQKLIIAQLAMNKRVPNEKTDHHGGLDR